MRLFWPQSQRAQQPPPATCKPTNLHLRCQTGNRANRGSCPECMSGNIMKNFATLIAIGNLPMKSKVNNWGYVYSNVLGLLP